MHTQIKDKVVVVTGASSGIGRATAHRLARHGATLVLAARRESLLAEAAKECRDLGADVMTVPTDVADEQAVNLLARRALERHGSVDVWVNNAAVTAFGAIDAIPMADFRRIVDVNLYGCVYAARAMLPVFRAQGHGVLINVGSVLSRVSQPYVGPYTISKHGLRALGMVLRQELMLMGADDVHVCTVMPGTIDTPLFQHGANYTGRVAKAMPPVYRPEHVARAIESCALRPRDEVFVGPVPWLAAQRFKLMPRDTERRLARMTDKHHFYGDRSQLPTTGNLYRPMGEDEGETGGWHGRRKTVVRRTAGAGLAVAAVAAARRTLAHR